MHYICGVGYSHREAFPSGGYYRDKPLISITMKQNMLLPHWCKTVGIVTLVPLAVVGILAVVFEVEPFEVIYNHTALYVALLSASLLMSAFSREKDEDEYVASVRTRYLMLSFYIDFVFLIVTAFTVFFVDYITVMAVQMFIILFLHAVMFNTAMAVIRSRRSHEK